MSWPSAVDFSAAVQSPSRCFADAELAQARPVLGLFDAPLSYSGNFACVFKLVGADKQTWAVKCFTRPVADLQARYAAISDHLGKNRRKFAVEFVYLPRGIQIGKEWYPIVKMDWVEGLRLNEFLAEHANSPHLIEQLCRLWLRLAGELRKTNMAHGDLQHGNVLLVEGAKAATMSLRLIDYDGMWVPALNGKAPDEIGHPNYQHPDRLRLGGYFSEVDRFAHLATFTALRCLMAGGKPLWQRHDNGENLLFSEADFKNPGASKLFAELLALSDPNAVELAGHLALASQGPLYEVPLLSELVDEGVVKPLGPAQLARLAAIVRPSRPASVPLVALPAEPLATVTLAEPKAKPATPPLPRPKSEPPPLPTQAPPRPAFSPALMLGVALGVVGVLLLGVVGGFAAWALRPAARPAPPAAPRLTQAAPVSIRAGGKAEVQVTLNRPRSAGALSLAVMDAPAGFRHDPVEAPAGDGEITVAVPIHAPPGGVGLNQPITVLLLQGGRVVDRRSTVLTVLPFTGPRFGALANQRLQAGEAKTVTFPVIGNGNRDVWSVQLKGLPSGIVQAPGPGGPAVGTVSVVLTPGLTQPATVAIVTAVLRAGDVVADQQNFSLEVEAGPVQITFSPVRPVTLKAGQRDSVVVSLNRNGYRGPLRIVVEELPKGVTARPVEVPAGISVITVELVAAAGEQPLAFGNYRLVAIANTRRVATLQARLDFGATAPSTPTRPPSVVAAPVLVRIPTGDGLRLHGTFYPAKDPKTSPCVLLIPDTTPGWNYSRNEYHWQELARGLQKDGCAVLTFDFRGHGENRFSDAGLAFWTHRANALARPPVKAVKGKRPPPSTTLDFSQFQAAYHPWLVQDIIAARFFLDVRHDTGDVNTSNLVVIAAGEGALLAAHWLATEARRGRRINDGPGGRTEAVIRDHVVAVWIDMADQLHGVTPPWPSISRYLVPYKGVPPMVFLHPRSNNEAEKRAVRLAGLLRKSQGTTTQAANGTGQRQTLLISEGAKADVRAAVATALRGHTMKPWVRRDTLFSQQFWVPSTTQVEARAAGAHYPALCPLSTFFTTYTGLRPGK